MSQEDADRSGLEPQKEHRYGAAVVSLLVPAVVLVLNWLALEWHLEAEQMEGRRWLVPVCLAAATLLACVLPAALWIRACSPGSRGAAVSIARVLLLAGAVVAGFWIAVPILVLVEALYYTHADPLEIVLLSLAVFSGAVIVALPLVLFAQSRSKGK